MTMHRTRIDIPPETRESLIDLLNARLADTVDLATQAKQAHWNVKGPSFIALHELFDKVADDVREWADMIAERATSLGGTALGTARRAAAQSTLDEYPAMITTDLDHAAALASAVAHLGEQVRTAIGTSEALGDAGTADLFTEISRGADKTLWFIEAHLQADR